MTDHPHSDLRLHPGYARTFPQGRMTLGLMFPIEAYAGPVPTMSDQIALARTAERTGFAALWARDVPVLDFSFGDAGQMFDPWVWLTHVGAHTHTIALGTASAVLPLRSPLDLAKSAASVDLLTGQRLLMGIATGDRPLEFPLYARDYETRGAGFRESVATLRRLWSTSNALEARVGDTSVELDVLPKPVHADVPLLVTGSSQQNLSWIVRNADGWLTYPRPVAQQRAALANWRAATTAANQPVKPFAQSLYIDLAERATTTPTPIHLGLRLGRDALLRLLTKLQDIGVAHVLLNLKYGRRPAAEVVEELGLFITPAFAWDCCTDR